MEQLADDSDIWRYAALRNPITFARAALGGEPDEWQKEFLRSRAKRLALSCGRQSGKSTMAAIHAIHQAVFQPNHLVLILSPSQRQSGELFRKISDIYHQLKLDRVEPTIQETALHIRLANQSRVVSLPGSPDTVRGYSFVSTLIIDEAARVNPDLWAAISPSLAVSDGAMILLSTPYGTDKYFASVCLGDDPEWTRWFISADQCPRITSEFLSKERKELGEWRFGEEYMNIFDTRNEAAYFDPLELEAALDPELEPL